METILRCADHHAGHLRVPMQLFHIALALMNKVQLCWDVGEIFSSHFNLTCFRVVLESEVPQSELIVSTSDGDRGALVRIPFDGGDGRFVPSEGGNRLACPESPQVPNFYRAVVRTRHEQIGHSRVPRDHVRIGCVRFDTEGHAIALTNVPDGDARVSRAGRKDRGLDRAPADVLHRRLVPNIWRCIDAPRSARRGGPHVNALIA
mmetsp:Transcript_19272/g.49755  ORF Transcript_19272/g.49755 Transcript_19272/m.49755 type:complete len:205 (-) Transcript_19272:104-718(-)